MELPISVMNDRGKNLKRQSQQLLSALSSACDFKSHFCK